MWAILAISAALLTSFNPILYKRILKDTEPITVVWVVTFLSLPLLGIYTLSSSNALQSVDRIFFLTILASAGLNAVAHIANARAIQHEDVSLVTPFLSFGPVFTILVAVITLGEIPNFIGLAGVALVLSGAFFLNVSTGQKWIDQFKSLPSKPGIHLVLIAGFLWSITPVLEKVAIQHTYPTNPRLVAFSVSASLVLILSVFVFNYQRFTFKILKSHKREILLTGLIAGSAPILGFTAFSLGFVGYVTTLFRLNTLLTMIWAAFFLEERKVFKQRLPAALLMTVGAILIVLSKQH